MWYCDVMTWAMVQHPWLIGLLVLVFFSLMFLFLLKRGKFLFILLTLVFYVGTMLAFFFEGASLVEMIIVGGGALLLALMMALIHTRGRRPKL